ncbi:MAG TPA: alcohol dehydrogenase catalytic domain-containing protein [Nocardioidaceae bacterium]|nr:alcohol dehydrogenase catalytic domain-containing protein [Nocardioidaceae bacterium]
MKALVYKGKEQRSWEDHADPVLQDPNDAVVRVDAVTICGTDLHILKGDVPTCEPPTILGHEAVGTVEQVGDAVRNVEPGDRVLISCITACGRCHYCREGRYGQCLGGGGWVLGHRIDGVQAEKVRVPFADTSTYVLPESVSSEAALMLADILPTSYEVGVKAGRVQPGQSVVVVGAGPVGLAAVLTAKLFSPYPLIVVDPAPARREAAKLLGADVTLSPDENVKEEVLALTDGLGADVAMEAVGIPQTFETCTELVRPGGHVANVGVHGKPATFHLETLWIRDITVTTGLVDTNTTPALLRMLANHQLQTDSFITHRFDLQEMEAAYDVFGAPEKTGALKVGLFRH